MQTARVTRITERGFDKAPTTRIIGRNGYDRYVSDDVQGRSERPAKFWPRLYVGRVGGSVAVFQCTRRRSWLRLELRR